MGALTSLAGARAGKTRTFGLIATTGRSYVLAADDPVSLTGPGLVTRTGSSRALTSRSGLLRDADLEQVGPVFAGDEQPLLLLVSIGNQLLVGLRDDLSEN